VHRSFFLFLLPQIPTAHCQVEKHDLLEHFLRRLADGFLPIKKVERQDALRLGQKQIQHHRGRQAGAKVLTLLAGAPSIGELGELEPGRGPEFLL
jgi:hypothetical protein